jgi:polysaccharide biosynthesis/export protein
MKTTAISLTLLLLLNLPMYAGELKEQEPQSAANLNADFVIGLEDVLAINVYKDMELSIKEVVVRPDGKISLPLLGDIKAEGLTVKQLQDQVADKLKEYVTAPVVTVTVIRILSQSVSIVGQVPKPGVFSLGAPITIMELLARAGGVTFDAKSKKIKIIRKEGGKSITIPFNYNDMVSGKDLNQNILVKNGDIIVVP